MGKNDQTTKPCPDCGGRGSWNERERREFTTYDKKGNPKTETGYVEINKRCSGRCKGSGYIYA